MVTRDFDAMLAVRAGVRPTFRVGGQEFTVKTKLPFRKFSAFLGSLEAGDDEMARTEEFFAMALIPADRQRFLDLLKAEPDDDDDESTYAGPEQIGEITQWLIEYYAGKASENSDSLSNGAGNTAALRNVVSLNPRAS